MLFTNRFIQKAFFAAKFRGVKQVSSILRGFMFRFLGMDIGEGTRVPKVFVTWPNRITIGNYCILEHNIYFKIDSIWNSSKALLIGDNVFIGSNCQFNVTSKITIGNNTLIASDCCFIDHNHGVVVGFPIKDQIGVEEEIIIGEDVWLGRAVTILKGVKIGSGAIVAAGAVVTKSIPEMEIWGGVPARKINERKIVN
ncbi:acyltransferase [Pedobacter sp. PWIIR3]